MVIEATLYHLKEYPMHEIERYTLDQAHAHFAKAINGEVWRLLEKSPRTPEEDEQMVHAAHACLYHWLHAGLAANLQRGLWLLARVYAVLGDETQALRYAERCLALTEAHPEAMADFDLAYAQEGMARALALAGRQAEAADYLVQARAAGEAIAGDEDREIFQGDLASEPWNGVV
jgi:hypothetical protein